MARRKGFPREFWRRVKHRLSSEARERPLSKSEQEAVVLDMVEYHASAKQIFRQTAKSILNVCLGDLVRLGEYVMVADGVMKHRNHLTDSDIIVVTSRKERATLGTLCGNARWLHSVNRLDECVRHLRLIAEVWPEEAQELATKLDVQL